MNTSEQAHIHAPAHAAQRTFRFGRPAKLALLMIALIGGFYLLREHWNHLGGNWVYLMLLACPLMHLFHGHGGHDGHGGHGAAAQRSTSKEE